MGIFSEPTEQIDFLEYLGGILSEESGSRIVEELRFLKKNIPSVIGHRQKPIHSIPINREECQEKLRLVLRRLSWTQRVSYLESLCRQDSEKKARVLEKKLEEREEENFELQKELERSRHQIRTLLGIKKSEESDKKCSRVTRPAKKKQKKRGAPPGHRGATRPLPSHVDETHLIPPPLECLHCGCTEIEAKDRFIDKYIEDIPQIIKMVHQVRYEEGECSRCGKLCVEAEALRGPPVAIGKNLTTTLALLRHEMGGSYRKLSAFCRDVCHISLSPSGVEGILHRLGEKLEVVYTGIGSRLAEQPLLHADETYWKMNGERWYLWGFGNENMIYFHPAPSRSSEIPKTLLGSSFPGLLITDFYSSYLSFAYTQKCLVHYLRDIRNELAVSPKDRSLKQVKKIIKRIIKKGKQFQKKGEHKKGKEALRKLLDSAALLQSTNPKAQTLINRIKKYGDSLINFVDLPHADSHNNWMEQKIRPSVIFRNLSFGNRSKKGANFYAASISVLETARLKDKNLSRFLSDMVNTPLEEMTTFTAQFFNSS